MIGGELFVFATFALLAVVSSLVVIFHRNPVYSTMSLVVTLFATAVLFVLLGAPFLGVLQLLLYTGAILVLFLFVIMLLNVGRERAAGGARGQVWAAAVGCLLLAGGLFSLVWDASTGSGAGSPPPALADISRELFSRYMLPFQIIGLLLLVAVVAATVIARRAPAAPDSEEV